MGHIHVYIYKFIIYLTAIVTNRVGGKVGRRERENLQMLVWGWVRLKPVARSFFQIPKLQSGGPKHLDCFPVLFPGHEQGAE